MKRFFIFVTILALMHGAAIAQDAPIEVTADKTLEWDQNAKTYTANGNAEIVQGTTRIKGDKIVAHYRESAQSDFDIYKIVATGSVTITNGTSQASGDVGIYDLDRNLATLTGTDLVMTLPDQMVTAKDRFEYDLASNQVKAIGDARVVRGDIILDSATLIATLTSGMAQTGGSLDKIDALGRVKITTPTEILTGDRGTYNAKTERAVITGNVKITRGPNVLTGERAELDMTTQISRMYGSSIEDGQTGGRVRGLFFRKSRE